MTAALKPVSHLAEALADAHASETPVRVIGSGTWLDGGRPVTASGDLQVRDTAGVIEYVPGDLVITVGAGTTLEELTAITREHNQWLALDPFGSDRGTIGATVATASSGPLASGVGRVRDLTLGLTLLTSDGSAVRAGGRVVKNVAGFDLVRLATGAFGTLGVITDVSLRLHARPAVDETIGVMLEAETDSATGAATLPEFTAPMLNYLAMEIVSGQTVRQFQPTSFSGQYWILLARVSGNMERARAQRALLEPLGRVREFPNEVWDAVRGMDGDRSAVVRVSDAPLKLGATLGAVQRVLDGAGLGHATFCATPSTGRVRVAIASDGESALRNVEKGLSTIGASVLWERLPADCWAWLPPAATDPVSLRIRDAFDPHHVLNRGIFGPMGGHA
ncbi:MAG: FAD-binding protein [Gemmatimonas sp.]